MPTPDEPSWSWLAEAAGMPLVTLDMYAGIPEDLARTIEIVDGMIVHCESPSENRQGVAQALTSVLGEAARKHDTRKGTCHRVRGDLDMLLTEVPFKYRTPDVLVYRCLPTDRSGRWKGKPYAMDMLIAVEVVSAGSRSVDLGAKRVEYAQAGIPCYWIVQLVDDDGPALSVERLRLTADRRYASEGVACRGRDLLAIDIIDPLEMTVSWDRLDEWL
jgi:Uma2 family endonuclease